MSLVAPRHSVVEPDSRFADYMSVMNDKLDRALEVEWISTVHPHPIRTSGDIAAALVTNPSTCLIDASTAHRTAPGWGRTRTSRS